MVILARTMCTAAGSTGACTPTSASEHFTYPPWIFFTMHKKVLVTL